MYKEPTPQVEILGLDKLKPYGNNPNRHGKGQIEAIADSLTQYGWMAPLLIDSKGEIIAGEGRYLAARLVREQGRKIPGWPDINLAPVVRRGHLSEAQKRAYVIADNKLAELSEWDDERLAAEINALTLEDFDLKLTGFSEKELKELLKPITGPEDPPPPKPGPDKYKEQYGVIVICADEAGQKKAYEELSCLGYQCRVVTT